MACFFFFYVFKNFQALVMALQVLVMTFACGASYSFLFVFVCGMENEFILIGWDFFFPWLQNFWSLCFCVCVCVTLH